MVVHTIHKTSFGGVSTILSDDLIWDIIFKRINTSILIVENNEASIIKPHEWYFHISPLLSMGPFLWAWHPISTAALVQCPPIAGNVSAQPLPSTHHRNNPRVSSSYAYVCNSTHQKARSLQTGVVCGWLHYHWWKTGVQHLATSQIHKIWLETRTPRWSHQIICRLRYLASLLMADHTLVEPLVHRTTSPTMLSPKCKSGYRIINSQYYCHAAFSALTHGLLSKCDISQLSTSH